MIYQFNVAQMKYPKDAPEMQSFFNAVPHVQRLAESSPGFIWREVNEDDPTIGKRLGTDFIVNLSAWESLDALYAFVFSQSHRQIMMARDHWFTHVGKALSVVWFANDAPYHLEYHEQSTERQPVEARQRQRLCNQTTIITSQKQMLQPDRLHYEHNQSHLDTTNQDLSHQRTTTLKK